MKKLKLNLSTLPGAEILTREQLKKVVGGMNSGFNCPPATYACICKDNAGNYIFAIDAYGQNIMEATQNALDGCESWGYSGGVHCNANWNC